MTGECSNALRCWTVGTAWLGESYSCMQRPTFQHIAQRAAQTTTPGLLSVSAGSDIDGSIMTTASHMPMQNNGLKFFTAEGGLDKSDITALLDKAANQCLAAGVALGDAMSDPGYVLGQAVRSAAVPERLQLLAKYAEHLAEVIKQGIKHPENYDKPLTGLKIIVDAGNGSGGFFATEVGFKMMLDPQID